MLKATKMLWLLFLSYFILCCTLSFLEIGSLSSVMAENVPFIFLSAIVIQFLIYMYNSFISGLKS